MTTSTSILGFVAFGFACFVLGYAIAVFHRIRQRPSKSEQQAINRKVNGLADDIQRNGNKSQSETTMDMGELIKDAQNRYRQR